MRLTDLLTEDSTLEDMEKLLDAPFEVDKADILRIAQIGEGQRQRSGYKNDHSVEVTAFYSYVAGRLAAAYDDLGRECFSNAIPHAQRILGSDDAAEKYAAARRLERSLGPLKHSAYFEKTDRIFDECFNHFIRMTPKPYAREKSALETEAAHNMNNCLVAAQDMYKAAVGK